VILTVDMGTSATKVALWDVDGLVALSTSPLTTGHPAPGLAEQDPRAWWSSVVSACADVRAAAADRWESVEVVGCTGARQTFACVAAGGDPLGPAIVWSDGRAGVEATALAGGSARDSPPASGIVVDGGSVAAKLAWLVAHDNERWRASRWILNPRDLVVWRLTGEVATDRTMASRSGLYDLDGRLVTELAGPAADLLPPVVDPGQVIGGLSADAAAAMALAVGTPVVIGPADRPAEVIGAGAGPLWPMVSWGTTANVSVPVAGLPAVRPEGIVLSRGAEGGWLLEGGLSAAGSLLAWLGSLTGRPPEELGDLAGSCPPGARGVTATPWLDGARAPWWQPAARVALVGLDSTHGPADLARAAVESVAWEVRRCLDAIGSGRPSGPSAVGLALGGGGGVLPVWREALTGITGLPARRRRSGQAASAGVALLAGRAVGLRVALDDLDPVIERDEPDPVAVDRYAGLRPRSDAVAQLVMALTGLPEDRDRPGVRSAHDHDRLRRPGCG
jgi:xylulokinase